MIFGGDLMAVLVKKIEENLHITVRAS